MASTDDSGKASARRTQSVTIRLAVAMLWLAPKVVPELSWLGLVAGLILTLKVYWFGFWFQTRRP